MSKVPPSGVWCPAVTFFTAQDTLDLDAQARYFSYLSVTGLAGLVVLGTNAETFLLTREERKALVATARKAVGPSFPIMAGIGGHSTAQVGFEKRSAERRLADGAILGDRIREGRYGCWSRFGAGSPACIFRSCNNASGPRTLLRSSRQAVPSSDRTLQLPGRL